MAGHPDKRERKISDGGAARRIGSGRAALAPAVHDDRNGPARARGPYRRFPRVRRGPKATAPAHTLSGSCPPCFNHPFHPPDLFIFTQNE